MKAAPFIYNNLIRVYGSAIRLASPFHARARKLARGHQDLLPNIRRKLAGEQAPRVWFHCASLGEFEQGRPVMEAFREQFPNEKIVLTFFSPSGYEVRKNYAGADYVFYLPFDTPANAKDFIAVVKPRLAFFVKYEFWYNYLHTLHQQQVPTFLISGIFRPGQLFFKKHGGFYRSMLRFFNQLFVQNEESVQLLRKIGVEQVSLSGDTRFDRVAAVCREPKRIPLAETFKADPPLLVVGSSWAPDLQVIAPLLRAYQGRLKCIIAPHEVDEPHLQEAETLLEGLKLLRFSQAEAQLLSRTGVSQTDASQTDASQTDAPEADVLLIDNVGMLSALYALGDYAYIGGSFGKGLHNILEAATFGMPVFFGNQAYHKFQEARDLIREGGAFAIADAGELQGRFAVLYEDESKRRLAAQKSAGYVQAHTGATRQIMNYVSKLRT